MEVIPEPFTTNILRPTYTAPAQGQALYRVLSGVGNDGVGKGQGRVAVVLGGTIRVIQLGELQGYIDKGWQQITPT
jgi:hypothetical protein